MSLGAIIGPRETLKRSSLFEMKSTPEPGV